MAKFISTGHEVDSTTGHLIGRDPRKMSVTELNDIGHEAMPLSKVIRKHCIECSGGVESEVRKCPATSCELWPYRMKKNPFSTRKGNPNGAEHLKKYREAKEND